MIKIMGFGNVEVFEIFCLHLKGPVKCIMLSCDTDQIHKICRAHPCRPKKKTTAQKPSKKCCRNLTIIMTIKT